MSSKLPTGTYAIRITRNGNREKFLIFENGRGDAIGTPIGIASGPTALQEAIESLLSKPFQSIEKDHMVRTGSDVLILVERKGDEEGLSGRLRKQEADKPRT